MRSHSSDRLVRLHQLPTIAETVEEEEDEERKRNQRHAEQPALWMCPRILQARSISEASGPRARAELRDRRKLLTDGRVLGKSGVSVFLSPGSSRCWSAFFFLFTRGVTGWFVVQGLLWYGGVCVRLGVGVYPVLSFRKRERPTLRAPFVSRVGTLRPRWSCVVE